MSRIEPTKGNGIRRTGASIGLAMTLVAGALATTSPVWADGPNAEPMAPAGPALANHCPKDMAAIDDIEVRYSRVQTSRREP